MKKEILEKALKLIPVKMKRFPKEGGVHSPVEDSWIMNSWWKDGWVKEGELLLNENGFITGKVTHINSAVIGGTWRWQEYYSGGEACYLLSYRIEGNKNKVTKEQATLYRIKRKEE